MSSLGSLGLSMITSGFTLSLSILELVHLLNFFNWRSFQLIPAALLAGLTFQLVSNVATVYSYAVDLSDCIHHRIASQAYNLAEWCYCIFLIVKTNNMIQVFTGMKRKIAKATFLIATFGLLTGRIMSYVGGSILYSTIIVPVVGDILLCVPQLHPIANTGIIIFGISDVLFNVLLVVTLKSVTNLIPKESQSWRAFLNLRNQGYIALVLSCIVSSIHSVLISIAGEYVLIPLLIDQVVIFGIALYSIRKEEEDKSRSNEVEVGSDELKMSQTIGGGVERSRNMKSLKALNGVDSFT